MTGHIQFFLRSEAVLGALTSLSSADDLVFYCGAGVSIDRTGLSWSQLLSELFKESKDHGRKNRERDHKAIDFLLKNLKDEEQRASILTEYFTENGATDTNEYLTSKLQQILYEENGWSEGNLLSNLVRLAIVAAMYKKSVTILTTNYDVYIEEEFIRVCKEMSDKANQAGVTVRYPGLERLISPKLPSNSTWTPRKIQDAVKTKSIVRIVYLHGRVGRPGTATEGTVVLDENSYSISRNTITDKIKEYIDGKSLLVAGASLTDGPLVEALALTKTKDATKQNRFALVHPTTTLDPLNYDCNFSIKDAIERITQDDVDRLLGYRGKHLGIHILHPMSHSQTAQFIEELNLALVLHGRRTNREYRDNIGISYEQRLFQWQTEWETNRPNPEEAHQILQDALKIKFRKFCPKRKMKIHSLDWKSGFELNLDQATGP
ncbi:SIR2 family protein [Arthrobacter sp. ERGS1:01]|uniref:SIR2 family protein n=1 Tax=Arthrobacter sp. ERGS1:01 TaxID=1704044 RepID=UPI0009E67C52|nr:SIR2 family protein [Arthrobacter sp. ERGS1:01]